MMPRLKDHEIAALINAIRDDGIQYAHTQQWRERIVARLLPVLKP